ncbi:MAG: serine/threonine-protein kinase, partial [Planctomycetota bacterium]
MNRVGPYEISGELGRDAEHDVALKVIAAGEDASAEALARFQREARIATELDHPCIVKVLEAGEHAGNAWFAMELVEGEPLSRQIKEREFTWQQAVTIVRDVADALAIAHDKGVLHRDIKPSNILMDAEGKPHLTDFGLAKDTRTESKYTRTGQTLGTPAYMSPEQARGDLAELTPASDVWSVGCVLYELLANRPAFEGDTPAAVIGHVMGGRPRPLQVFAQQVPAPVRELVEACLSKAPRHRPASAGALRADLDRVAAGRRPHHRAPRRRAPWLIAITATLLAAAAGGAVLWPRDAPSPTIDPEAERLAARGWAARIDRPGDGAELLGRALTIEDGRH